MRLLKQIYRTWHVSQPPTWRLGGACPLGGSLQLLAYDGAGMHTACLAEHIDARDYMVTLTVGWHDLIAKGVPLRGFSPRRSAAKDGINKGKGGAPHISYPENWSDAHNGYCWRGCAHANGPCLSRKFRVMAELQS